MLNVTRMQVGLALLVLLLTKWLPRTMIIPSLALTVGSIVTAVRWLPPELGPDPFAPGLAIALDKAGVAVGVIVALIALTFSIVRAVEDRRERRDAPGPPSVV